MKRYIGLITDFGEKDYFIGVLKGVISKINPDVEVIDIANGLPSFYIDSASFVVEKNLQYFPPNTIFLVVIDPGVGTDRGILLVSYERYYLVAPDNGVLTPILKKEESYVRVVDATHYFLTDSPSTFEARDKMAPIAAYLSKGVDPSRLGSETDEYIIKDNYYPSVISENEIEGKIVYIDKFGNLITNISKDFLFSNMSSSGSTKFKVEIKGNEITQFARTYADGKGSPFMLIGSHGNLEISMNMSSAFKYLKAGLNAKVKLMYY